MTQQHTARTGLALVLGLGLALGAGAANITIDGDFADWADVPVLATDPADNAGEVDFLTLQVANNADFVYVRYTLNESVNPQGGGGVYLAVDEDNSTFTGFDIFGLGIVGSDAAWQNDFPFEQAAGVFNTDNGLTNATLAATPYNAEALSVEFSVPRSAGHAAGGAPVFPADGEVVRIALWTENGVGDFLSGAYTMLVREPPFTTATVANVAALSFDSQAGVTYRLQYAPGLPATDWIDTGFDVIGNGSNLFLYDPTGFSTAKVYRIFAP